MIDDIDRAQAREAEMLCDALQSHARRAGLAGKTVADSAAFCQAHGCEEPIPSARRKAVAGCQYCAACQSRIEKSNKGVKAR